MQDVPADQSQHFVQQPLCGSDLQTRKLCVVLHPPPVDRRGRKSGEPSRISLDTPRHMAPGDPGVGAASSGAALLGTLKSDPRITNSYSELLVSSLSWGPAPSTSTLAAPSNVPSAPDTSDTGTDACWASGVGSFSAKVSHCATTDHNKH
jgi:hypothetical protein